MPDDKKTCTLSELIDVLAAAGVSARVLGDVTAPWAEEFFDTGKLMAMLDDHFEGRALNQRKIYTALTFLIWYKRYFVDEKAPAAA